MSGSAPGREMRQNKALATWRAGGSTIGGWLSIGNAYTAETMSSLGFDWLCVDLQHGMYLEQGFNLVTLGTDSAFLARAAANDLAAARKTAESKREHTGY